MTLGVRSEIGQLRQAIIHRPGLELSRLTPQNIRSLLFDDVLWAQRAKEEHDVFAETLREHGVRVHYFGRLLAETLEVPAGREFVLDRVCTPENLGPSLVGPVHALFDDLGSAQLAEYLVGGVLKADLRPLRAKSLKWDMLRGPTTSCCRRCPTTCSPGTTPARSTAGSRSTRWPSRPGSGNPCTSGPSTGTTRCSPAGISSPTTGTTTRRTCPPASRAAMCTCWATEPC